MDEVCAEFARPAESSSAKAVNSVTDILLYGLGKGLQPYSVSKGLVERPR